MGRKKKVVDAVLTEEKIGKISPPETGITVDAVVERVKDGDTIEVSVTRRFSVRLMLQNNENLMFNTASIKTEDGKKAREALEKMIPSGKEIRLFVPTHHNVSLMDFSTFNRILAEIWVDGECVPCTMINGGYASLVKREDIGE